jgi:hypothetical protein
MNARALALACLTATLAPTLAHAQSWYDANELVRAHVHPAQQEALASELEVHDLAELPLYDLWMAIPADLSSFGLRETVWITNTESAPLADVVFRVFANRTIAEGQAPPVTLVAARCLDGASCTSSQPAPSVIRLALATPVPPGGHLRVELDLTGTSRQLDESQMSMMAQGMASMQAMSEGAEHQETDYGLLAHGQGIGSYAAFFPVLARRDGGHWITEDQGTTGDLGTDAMANVRARIVVPSGVRVVTSGNEVSRRPVRERDGHVGDRVEITVHAGVIRDFALLAGATLQMASQVVGDTLVRSYFLPDDAAPGRAVLDTTAHALSIFEARFGPYPYTELDVVEAPLVGGAGGVEFSALVTVASMFYRPAMEGGGEGEGLGALSALLGGGGFFGEDGEGGEGEGEGASTPTQHSVTDSGLPDMQASVLEFVTAHEAAHQWWHGIVGSDSRMHPFVDESLAQYSAMLYFEDRYSAARAEEEGERQVAMNYHVMRLQHHQDGAVDRAASAFTSPIDYAGLVYGKGPYMYRALRHELGDEAFFAGLRQYVTSYRMRVAPPRGVIDALATGVHARRVRQLATRWLEQRHGDDDLGPSTPDTLLRGMLPPEMANDPQVRAMLGPLVQQMLGGGGGGGLPQMLGGGGSGGLGGLGGGGEDGEGISPEMLQQLEQMMGGME